MVEQKVAGGVRRLGADPGRWRTALAVVELGPPHRVLALSVVDSDRAVEEALALAQAHGVLEAVVERTTRGPWHRKVPRGELLAVARVGEALEAGLSGAGVRVRRPLAVRPGAWYGGQRPGWRQRFTGLLHPSEADVYATLRGMRERGELLGKVPKHPGLADAIAMALLG